jgi:NAD(P)-dependent dehydrogenase (short-subunit alcohol dehydrogenase family)
VNEYITRQGRLDVVLNVAGILRVISSTEVTLEQFKTVIDTNLIGTFLMCRICLPHLILTKGNIINTASTAAFFGHPYMAAYAASKGAIVSLTKSLAREYILQGVRVNAIAPGGTATPIHKSAIFPKDANLSIMSNLRMPDNRFGQPDEIAAVVAMLGSQDGSFINGEVIRIDGGVHS